MKLKVITSTLLLFISLFVTSSALAHSGCCSWHGGVRADGCGCNDGTPLSSTCEPYYTCNAPQQTNTTSTDTTTNTPVYVPPTDTPTPFPTDTPMPTFTPTPTVKPTSIPIEKHQYKQSPYKPKSTPIPHKSWWQWLFGWL